MLYVFTKDKNMSSFLNQFKRQPKIFLDLPCQGNYWQEGTLESFSNVPIFGMTAMDEILIKTPDALFSGESTAKVIESCVPSIKDAWAMPSYDLDFLLIAIRIATYGEAMDIETTCPYCKQSTQSTINLNVLLENFASKNPMQTFSIKELTINIKPLTYRQWSKFNIDEYTSRRQILNYQKQNLDEIEKEKIIRELLDGISTLSLNSAVAQIDSIQSSDGRQEKSPSEILDFITNTDQLFYKQLQNNIERIKDEWTLPQVDVKCTNEECNKTYSTRLTMDYSNFFVNRS